jgi:hypothetical protein
LKRTHGEDAINSLLANKSTTHANENFVTSPNAESSVTSESGESAGDEMEDIVSKPLDKASLLAKMQELQMLKEESMAKFDGDIAALKRVLSLM